MVPCNASKTNAGKQEPNGKEELHDGQGSTISKSKANRRTKGRITKVDPFRGSVSPAFSA